MMDVYSDIPCALGEGPLWHPQRETLFWFDILGKRLFSKGALGEGDTWQFDEYVSAAGWVDRDTLLVASASGLWRCDIDSQTRDLVVDLEADDPRTRSNDGRADPQGGFWIGTMGIHPKPDLGSIYRYYKGDLRQLFAPISIPNAISFSPDGHTAYFADTPTQKICKVALDNEGWPIGDPDVFVDLRAAKLLPDGAVVDADGNLWNAQWGAGRVTCYSPDGTVLRTVEVPASQTTCPAFDGTRLFVTSAADGFSHEKGAGLTYTAEVGVKGQREHRVII